MSTGIPASLAAVQPLVLPSDTEDRGEGNENFRKPKPKSPDPAPSPIASVPGTEPEVPAPAPSEAAVIDIAPAEAQAAAAGSTGGKAPASGLAPQVSRTEPANLPGAAPPARVSVEGQPMGTAQGLDLAKFMQLWGGMGLTVIGAAAIWQFLRMRRNRA